MRFSTLISGAAAIFATLGAAGSALAQAAGQATGAAGAADGGGAGSAAGAAAGSAAGAAPDPTAALGPLTAIGKPVEAATGFQPAATIVARHLQGLDGMITDIMTVIVAFVTILLVYVIFRFGKKRNPVPSTFTHNTPLEVAWTLIPVVILVVIGAYSLPVLFEEQEIPKADLTVRVTGNQWYWHYDYAAGNPDGVQAKFTPDFGFDSYMIGSPATLTPEDEKAGVKPYIMNPAMAAKLQKAGYSPDEFRLAVDKPMVVPVGKTVVVQVTGADVIHSWTVPAFGVKQDAVPGRVAELWFRVDRPGVYFGQCSELCGKDHAFMPIEVRAVNAQEYQAWAAGAKKLFAGIAAPSLLQVAANE